MLKYLDASCLGIPFQTLHQQLDNAWMLANPEGWPPENEGDCTNDWQSVKGSCWGYWNSQGISFPCAGFACCSTNYSICIVNGQRVINVGVTHVDNAANCEAQNCFPVCRF
ncbi:MAG: hypothetical protein JST22_01325 [Bacteroidetes bacterium]|nr:hypothetical protein [Bacteroidota bacterium]